VKFETIAIRKQTERSQHKEHSTPIFTTSSFVFDDAEHMRAVFAEEQQGNVYSRYSNPTVREFEEKLALLEGGEDARGTASGMSAIFTTFACFLSSGDHVLMSQAVFGSTIKLMENFFHKWGITWTLVNSTDVSEWEAAITSNTKLVYVETPSNPGLEIFDLESMASLFKSKGILTVVDNCFATPYLQQPLKWGIDLVVHSATKYIDGQGRVMGGAIVGSKEHISKIEPFMRNAGPTLAPFNAWILTKSLETLAIRMDRHCDNALKLALWLESQDKIKNVRYPFLDSHAQNSIAKKQMKSGGGIVAFEVNGEYADAVNLINNTNLFSISPNLGDTRSIITHPASSTHSKLSEQQRLEVGITKTLIRVSTGLEHIDDIISDVEYALSKM
jgi:O-succinylhomoserine sulfhydrylase